eukprot:759459-Hanusia_phi.AAC.3
MDHYTCGSRRRHLQEVGMQMSRLRGRLHAGHRVIVAGACHAYILDEADTQHASSLRPLFRLPHFFLLRQSQHHLKLYEFAFSHSQRKLTNNRPQGPRSKHMNSNFWSSRKVTLVQYEFTSFHQRSRLVAINSWRMVQTGRQRKYAEFRINITWAV